MSTPAEARLEWLARATTILAQFQAVDHGASDENPGAVHHLYYLKLDSTAGVWAVDDWHAEQQVKMLRELLRFVLDDDELTVELELSRACEAVR